MLTVWGRATSVNVQSIMWCAAELGLEVTRIDAGGAFGGLDSAEFMAMTPHRQIPVLRDGDVTLWESGAMLRYLASRYGSGAFWPEDAATRAPIDMWAEWAKVTLYASFTYPIFIQLVRVPASERDTNAVQSAITRFQDLMHRVEARVGAGPFFLGRDFTLADIAVGHLLYRPFELGILTPESHPHTHAYYQRLAKREAFATHSMVDFSALRAPGA